MLRAGAIATVVLFALAACVPGDGQVTPVVEFAGIDPMDETQVTAWGYVAGVSETGGTCTFTFWAAGGSASRLRGTGTADGDRTVCGPVSEGAGFLFDTDYEVELTYDSDAVAAVRSARVPMALP